MSDAYTLIQNGLIIDGTGSDPFPGDVLISGQRIVAVGADAGAKDARGHTPLFACSTTDAGAIAMLLIRAGADTKHRNEDGLTAFEHR